MAGQTANSGLTVQAIGQYFSYRLLVIPAVALLMVMTTYASLRSNRVYAGGAGDAEVNLGQESLGTENKEAGDFALDTRDTNVSRGDGRQQPILSYPVQASDEDLDVAGTQGGYSNVSAMTAFNIDWGTEDSGILSAFLGHLKKTLPKARIYHPADQMVAGASEA